MAVRNEGPADRAAALTENPTRDTGAGSASSGLHRVAARPRRVLLVEDEDMVRKVVGRMLAARGYDVSSAASGAEALALLDAPGFEDFDLLVTDLMMPDGSGLGVARSLTARSPKLRVLLVSGYAPSGTEGWDPGRLSFLTKPFGSAELGRAIDELFQEKPAS